MSAPTPSRVRISSWSTLREELRPRIKELRYSLHLLRKSLLAVIGLAIVLVFIFLAIAGPSLAPMNYIYKETEKNAPPGIRPLVTTEFAGLDTFGPGWKNANYQSLGIREDPREPGNLTLAYASSDTAGEGPISNIVAASPLSSPAPPSEPRSLRTTVGNETVSLAWDVPSSDGSRPIRNYSVYRGTTRGGETFLISLGNVLLFVDTGLTNNVTYYYQVSASNVVGEGLKSQEVSGRPNVVVASAPQNLVATAGDAAVVLTWEAPTSDGGSAIINYTVYRSTTPNPGVPIAEGPFFTYTDSSRTNNVTYYYAVTATNAVGQGPKSDVVTAIPRAAPQPPAAPGALVASVFNSTITLLWQSPFPDGGPQILGYNLYRGTVPGQETLLRPLGKVVTYTDAAVTVNTTYYYQVSALNAIGESPRSPAASEVPRTTPPAALQDLRAAAGDGSVTLTWGAPPSDGGSRITNYTIYRTESLNNPFLFVAAVSDVLTFTDMGVTNGANYFYRVSAVNGARNILTISNFQFGVYTSLIEYVGLRVEENSTPNRQGSYLSLAVSWDGGKHWSAPQDTILRYSDEDAYIQPLDFTRATRWIQAELDPRNFTVRVIHDANLAFGTGPIGVNLLRAVVRFQGYYHVLGTTVEGQDVLAGILMGAPTSMRIGLIVVGIATLIGSLLGALSGYFGGSIDELVMRITDVFLSIPGLILAMAVAAALGRNLDNVMYALIITWWPAYTRLVRGQALSVRENTFIEAARASGASETRVVTRHILPNTLSPILVQASLDVGSVVLVAAGLSFLGLGAQPGTPEWGLMVSTGFSFFPQNWWQVTFAGLMIFWFVLGFNLLGDGVRDITDPRLRR